MWTHQGPTKEYLMGYEKVRKNVLSQEAEMQTCGPKMGKTTCTGKKRHLGGSGTCEGTPHEERKRKDDAI